MRMPKLTILALALAGAIPARAADPAPETKKELQALKDKVDELEKAIKAAPPAQAAAPASAATAGMTPDQVAQLNRATVKVEALEDGRDASGLKGFKFSGYMDPSYVYNFNKERGTFQFVVPISKEPYAYDNGYFGTLALDVQKEMDSGTKFHLTLYPARGGGDVMGEGTILHEASVWVPVGDYKLFAGQLPDWSGYEYYAPNMYKNVTHNLLFDFTLPSSYTGVGLEVPVGKLDLKLMLANMNASVRNVGEHIPMFVFRGDYGVSEFWGWGFAGAVGYKTNYAATDGKDSLYTTFEVDCWYTRGNLTLNGHVTYGSQQKASITPNLDTTELRPSMWAGASVLAAYKFTLRTEGALRADFIYDQKNGGGLLDYTVPDPINGIGPDPLGGDPNKGANRYAITATLNYNVNANVILKGEYRYDGADLAVFGNKAAIQDYIAGAETPSADAKYKKANSVVGGAVVLYF